MRALLSLLSLLLFTLPAVAQDRPNTILVMDGSGSMWGQIDGVAKITIAQDVVRDLVDSLPEDTRLGLMAYGHRERGNCTDIEMLVPPGQNTRRAINRAVRDLKPLGKTPMTDSVIAAAEALRYTEDSATVILVSDGVETCNPDPCAAARALEQAGVNFTAHVVGFDVAGDAEAIAQMQCLAEETGGRFLTAANASELGEALTQVVQDPPERPQIRFRAVSASSGDLIEDPIQWTVINDRSRVAMEREGNPVRRRFRDGTFLITAYRPLTDETVGAEVTTNGAPRTVVELAFADPGPTATLDAPEAAPAGSVVMVGWTGPEDNLDNIQVGLPGERYNHYTYVDRGNPVALQLPWEPGTYELRYSHRDRDIIVTRPIEVTEAEVFLDAPDTVAIGADIPVTWTGPDANLDNVQVGEAGGRYTDYVYTERGNPLTLTAPGTPGTYELRYAFLDRQIIFTRPLEVTPAEIALDFPPEVPVGSEFEVTWQGPDANLDNIQIGPVGGGYVSYAYTERGNPVTLRAPAQAGAYEVRYSFRDRDVLFTRPITVLDVKAQLVAPDSAPAGSTITVGWDGPDNDRDFISVGTPGERYLAYAYTSAGNPSELRLPTEPGTYELRYQLAADNAIIATRPIEVLKVGATLSAPAEAIAGDGIEVTWTGPDYPQDYIGIGPVGASGGDQWQNYTRTSDGSPLRLTMPTEPGDYVIRYFVAQDRSVLASVPITLTGTTAELTLPEEAVAGSTIEVTWTGPDYTQDYIGIGPVGATGGDQWQNYTRTSDGSPLRLTMPTEPGDYLVQYFVAQDRSVLTSAPLKVVAVEATLAAPDTAVAGSTIQVDWTGPDYRQDYIGIGPVGAGGGDQWQNYTRTSDGAPADLVVPTTPGDYLIRYFVAQDRSALAAVPLTVTAVKAQLLPATPSGAAGGDLIIAWDGPDYRQDYIGIGPVGATGGAQWQSYVRTNAGNPATLTLPDEPGDYVIQYFLAQDRSVIASVPFTVE